MRGIAEGIFQTDPNSPEFRFVKEAASGLDGTGSMQTTLPAAVSYQYLLHPFVC
jgi:hypothetical protein